MSGKGSNRRPQEAPDEQVADNWARIFGDRKADQAWVDQQRQDYTAKADHKDVE